MPAQVTKLIQKLKRAYPELSDEPMLDDIEAAAYDTSEEDAPAQSGPEAQPGEGEIDNSPQQSEPASANGEDQLMPDLEKEADLMNEAEAAPEAKPKRKRKSAEGGSDMPAWTNASY